MTIKIRYGPGNGYTDLEFAYRNEQPPTSTDVERLHKAVGVALPSLAVRRFEEVKAFHESVVANRRKRLKEQIQSIRHELSEAETRSMSLDAERSEILRFLDGSGALEDFTALQERLATLAVEAAAVSATRLLKYSRARRLSWKATG